MPNASPLTRSRHALVGLRCGQVILPWLYCPLVWVLYNVGFQMLGNSVLFAALVLQAFAPMSYFIVGS